MKGYVVSDFHKFTSRSQSNHYEPQLQAAAAKADFLVMNGDMVDFKWSTIGSTEETITAAIDWLTNLLTQHPTTGITYILGNHDALQAYADQLTELAQSYDHFSWHPTHVQIEHALFHHGDLLLKTDPQQHWQRLLHTAITPKGSFSNFLYNTTVASRLHTATALLHAPQNIANRVVRALQKSPDPGHKAVTDVYIGHTHTPFTDFEIDGIRVHNTGSAIKHLDLKLLPIVTEGLA